jgi:predicted nucleic acid-binding protein
MSPLLLDTNTLNYILKNIPPAAAARFWAERHRFGKGISDLDLLLATQARTRNATLVTTNTRHFTGLGIALEDWTL